MNLPPKLLKLLTHHQHIFSKHLDDTLLNRLETCLYCLHSTHASFWKALEARHLDSVLDSLEQLPDDIELACGLLKIKFAIVFHFRNGLNDTVSSRVSSLLEKLLTSEDPLIICAVGRFMKSVLMEPKTLATFHEIHSSPLIPALRRSYDLSENIVHRKALLNSLLFLLFSQICAQKDISEDAIDGLLQFSQSAKNSIDPFHIDFCTHLVKFSECLQFQPANLLLAKLSSLVEAVLTALPSTLSADALEDSLYLLLVICPLLSKNLAAKVCAEVLPRSTGRVAVRTLRRALVNDVLRECQLSDALVTAWYSEALSALQSAPNGDLLRLLSPLASCQSDFLALNSFRKSTPADFVPLLWSRALANFDESAPQSSSSVLRAVWNLLGKYIPHERPACNKSRFNELLKKLNGFSDRPVRWSAQESDVFCLLYIHSEFDPQAEADAFDAVFQLAYDECSTLHKSGGILFHSFLLLRIFDFFLTKAVTDSALSHACLKLIELQELVSLRVCANPGEISNDSILSVQRGLFLCKLLDDRCVPGLNGEVLQRLLTLSTRLASAEGVGVPGVLKGTLLACLLHCLSTCQFSTNDSESACDDLLAVCMSLLASDVEEDPAVRSVLISSWRGLVEASNTSGHQLLHEFVAGFCNRSRAYAFLHETPLVYASDDERADCCPECMECLPSLLEDIIVAKRPAGEADCIGD
ncbi:hypothetical protein AAHC03_01915 [Spirometra sp. Aus1]